MPTSTQKTLFNEINITPLTDIFLVLLIIMMVVAPMLEYPGLKLAVPTIGPDAETTEDPKTQTVAIGADNQLYTDTDLTDPLPNITLRQVLKDNMAEKTDGLVIAVHPRANHGAMTMVMDTAQGLGITKMAVTALPDDDTSAIPADYR